MRLNLLVATSQINSQEGKSLGTGTVDCLRILADIMTECGIKGDIYDLPNGSHHPEIASPFSLNNGFALNTDELNFRRIPELTYSPDILKHIETISASHHRFFKTNRTVSYTLKRTLMPWILEESWHVFSQQQYEHRRQQFEEFCHISRYWLEDYALYEIYKEENVDLKNNQYRNQNSLLVKKLKQIHQERLDYYRYIQFLCYEQRFHVRSYLKKLNINLIVNLPFGVELNSADVFFHPEVFDPTMQVGCSPEPEHGYPEQAWGIAAYKEQTPGLKKYLEERMGWISHLGDGIFLDHLVGWCGQYVLPITIPEDSIYPHGHFLTDDHEKRKTNLYWFFNIIKKAGLQIRGEIAGDGLRVKATKDVIEELIKKGNDIKAMSIPRWETVEHKLKPLNQYDRSDLVMVETHDTSTLLQYLINRKGYDEDFESVNRILEFCNRVLGLPFHECDVPITIEECADDFWFEICRRLSEGLPSEDLVFTLPGLISILSHSFRSTTIENNINVKPGTSGAVGNGWRNWSYFSPPIESMINDPDLKAALKKLGPRKNQQFDYFHELEIPDNTFDLKVIFSKPSGRNVIYRKANRQWATWTIPDQMKDRNISLELVIFNSSEEEAWQKIDLASIIDLNKHDMYNFQDLNDIKACYSYPTEDLRINYFFIKLKPKQIHHFIIYQGQNPIVLS